MIGGKKFKTLRQAKKYLAEKEATFNYLNDIYHLHGKVYKYFVGTHLEWLNL